MAAYVTQDHGIGAVTSETAYGVDAFGGSAPSSGILPFANLVINQTLNEVEGDRLTATAAAECTGRSPQNTTVEWDVILTGSASAGTAPAIAPILKACNFKETIDPGVSVSYSPSLVNNESDTPSATFVFYERIITANQARRILSRGVKSNLTMTLTMGQEARISGSGMGLYDAYPSTTSALPTLPTVYGGDNCAWIVNNLALEVGGVVYPVSELTFATSWTLTEIPTGDATGGGTTSEVLLTLPKSGAAFGGAFNLVDGATALTAAIVAWQSGAKVTLTGTIAKGSRAIDLICEAVQLTPAGPANETFQIGYRAVRADGTDGSEHVKLVFR